MTHEEILEKAIEKAMPGCTIFFNPSAIDGVLIIDAKRSKSWSLRSTSNLIFSHDFAKAFWGENARIQGTQVTGRTPTSGEVPPDLRKWQYHLQQMVLEEDPIKYLEKYL